MKTKYFFAIVAAMMLQLTTVKADTYTDGIKKLLDNEAIASISAGASGGLAKATDGNAKEMETEINAMMVEWMAPYYRENMSESEFNKMVDYYLQPEYLAVEKKVFSTIGNNSGDFEKMIDPSTMQTLMMGGTPENIKMPECDPQLLKEVQHAMDMYDMVPMTQSAMSAVKDGIMKQMEANIPADQREMVFGMFNKLFSYLDSNMGTILAAEMVKSVTLDEMKTLNAIEKESFFPSYKKANSAMVQNMKPVIEKMFEKALKK